eukprot:UN29611
MIYNADDTYPYSVPWMVSIQRGNQSHSCGAAIISKNVILTAAHCVEMYDEVSILDVQVVIGEYDRQVEDESDWTQRLVPKGFAIHPKYENVIP